MSDPSWLSNAQMARLELNLPRSGGKPRVDDHKVLIGVELVKRNALRRRDGPEEFGRQKTLHHRRMRRSDKDIFTQRLAGLAAEYVEEEKVMIDATCRKADRTATIPAAKEKRGMQA